MTALIVSRGLPGSGKTSHALGWQAFDPENRAIVSRDGFRTMLHGYKIGVSPFENQITGPMLATVKELLSAGKSVWVDGTNLRFREVRAWLAVAEAHNASWHVRDFTEVDVDLCVLRDSQRPITGQVGEEVIRKMHKRFIKGQKLPEKWEPAGKTDVLDVEPYEPDWMAEPCIIVDIDGTLAKMNGRSPYDYSRVGEDLLNTPVVDYVHSAHKIADDMTTHVLLVSGRPESCRESTEAWLARHGVPYDQLYMRSDEEHDQQVRDDKVKLRIFNEYIRNNYRVHSVLDDRDRVVAMWRSLGLTCLQVAPGDF